MKSARAKLPSTAEGHATAVPQVPKRVVAPIALGAILQPLNSSMIAVALVSIRAHFAAGASVTWLVSALYLATAVAAPAMGRLADLLGPRRVSLSGLALIGLASALAPFAPSVAVLVVYRVLIGIGSAAQYPCGMAMLRHAADRRHAGYHGALGALSVASQVSAGFGPALGGLLVGLFGWGGIFWTNLPLCALAAGVILVWGPADPPAAVPERGVRSVLGRLDLPGMLLFVISVGTLMFWLLSLAQEPQWWWLAAVFPGTVLLLVWSLRAREPFLDVRLVGAPGLGFTYLRTIATYTVFYGVFYGLPQWLEESRGIGPTGAGLVMLPVAAFGALSTVLATRLQLRRGPWPSLVVGTAALLAGGLLLTIPTVSTPLPILLATCAVLGLPNGFNNMGNQTLVFNESPAGRAGAASGMYRTAQYVGANIAAAFLALVVGVRSDDAGLHRLGLSMAIMSAVLLLAALAGWWRRATSRA